MKIVLAGATGNLGQRIARELVRRGADVHALVRKETPSTKTSMLEGCKVVRADLNNPEEVANACAEAACVVSALSGLRDVIVETQARLLEGAEKASVARFIPSDFAADFMRVPPGENRNFDLRREFRAILEKSSIKWTSINNGMFADMLTGQAPFILFPLKRVVYWENPDQKMDFTTMDDTAVFTSMVALDAASPRELRVAGSSLTARELAVAASRARGGEFKLFRAGKLETLERLIHVGRAFSFDKEALYPAWQGMQYMHNMYSGRAQFMGFDNDRYSIDWTPVEEVLKPSV